MIIKKIILNNIRSYESQIVEFPRGSTLLSGDIGSGKTSILLGIEFALFGLQPGQRGNSILRNGETKGGVSLEFDVDGREIIVERTLKRGKSVSQDYCAITVDGEKKELSVTELKDKVLEIINYPKEFSKKQNLLYKFTVYTPQEEMKQIILQDSETRINTLRHVFGIDKYKQILENTSVLISKIREEKRLREGMIENLEEDKSELTSKEEELNSKRSDLIIVEKSLILKSGERKKAQEEMDKISEKIEERRNLQQEIEKTKIMISNKQDSILGNEKLIENLEAQLSETPKTDFAESSIKNIEKELASKKIEKENLNEENLRISSQISSFELKIRDNDELRKKLAHLEICPTCLQNVDPVYKSNVINKVESDTSENLSKIKSLTLEKNDLVKKIALNEEEIFLKERKLQEFKILKIKLAEVEDKKRRVSDLKKINEALEKDRILLGKHSESLASSVFELGKFESVFESKRREFEETSKSERITEIKVAELRKEIEVFSRQIEELRERIKKTEGIKNKLEYITKLETFFTKNFVPMVSLIERNVMIKLKVEFSKLFGEWFSMLVSDTFDVRLDDDFTPVIEHRDYEIDYNYLSGGERTAIALAYRLSLNQVINSIMSKIKTRNLVILDEPTDGFSEQQLDKMRDVLNQLEVEQLIIVSHEQKIEGFVENVIRFKKEHGVSGIDSENFIK